MLAPMDSILTLRRLTLAGIAGPLLFVVVFLVEGATRAGYDPRRQFVSLLSLGDGGWVQVADFVVTGALFVGFAAAIGRSWRTGIGARWVPRLVAAVGIAMISSGVFTTDPAQGYPPGTPAGLPTEYSWHADIHFLGAAVVFIGLPAAGFIAARRASRRGDRAMAWFSLACGAVMLAAWIAAFAVPALADDAGLCQRIAVAAGFGWLVVLARSLLRLPNPVPASATIVDPVAG
jgi:uncharacterized protein DUF998